MQMNSRRTQSSSNKKGLSLSLGKKGLSLNKELKNANQQQISKVTAQHWHLYPPLQRKVIPNNIPLKSQVVIYRFPKTQWQVLQQKNKNKRQIVNKMRSELQFLNHKLPRTQFQQIPIFESSYKVSVISPMKKQNIDFKNHHLLSAPTISIFNTNLTSQQNKKHNPNEKQKQLIKQGAQKIQDQYKIKVIQPVEFLKIPQNKNNVYSSVKKVQISQKQNCKIPNPSLTQRKSQFCFKRNLIDINTLADIQQRLNKLIDQTKF